MTPNNLTRARNFAATLITLSGISQIAELWFRDIDTGALAGAGFGAMYIMVGIGLFGRSRFVLFMGMVLPAIGLRLALSNTHLEALTPLGLLQVGCAALVIMLSALVLYGVRNNPSV